MYDSAWFKADLNKGSEAASFPERLVLSSGDVSVVLISEGFIWFDVSFGAVPGRSSGISTTYASSLSRKAWIIELVKPITLPLEF